jgi:hypothetical protein
MISTVVTVNDCGTISLGYVDLKKKRLDYPSVMSFDDRLASGSQGICDIFAEFIVRSYVHGFRRIGGRIF